MFFKDSGRDAIHVQDHEQMPAVDTLADCERASPCCFAQSHTDRPGLGNRRGGRQGFAFPGKKHAVFVDDPRGVVAVVRVRVTAQLRW